MGFYDGVRLASVDWMEYEDSEGKPFYYDPVYLPEARECMWSWRGPNTTGYMEKVLSVLYIASSSRCTYAYAYVLYVLKTILLYPMGSEY